MTPIVLPLEAPAAGARPVAQGESRLVEAKVLQSVEPGVWLVAAGGATLMVRAERPLEVGQTVLVPSPGAHARPPGGGTEPSQAAATPPPNTPSERAEALPRLLAALAEHAAAASRPEPPATVAARLLAALDAHARAQGVPERTAAAIRAVLRPTAEPLEPAATAEVLRRAVEDTGSLFEARTARLLTAAPASAARPPETDVRTLVGSVLARLASAAATLPAPSSGEAQAGSPPGTEALRTALADAGRSALVTQVETAAHAEANGPWRVEIPLQFGDRRVHLECEFEADGGTGGRQGRGRPAGQLHVLVTPDGVAPLEARFSWRGEDAIAVDVYVDTDARAAALAGGREALAERLEAAGFAKATVDVWANPARLARWATRRAATPPAGRALDTHA